MLTQNSQQIYNWKSPRNATLLACSPIVAHWRSFALFQQLYNKTFNCRRAGGTSAFESIHFSSLAYLQAQQKHCKTVMKKIENKNPWENSIYCTQQQQKWQVLGWPWKTNIFRALVIKKSTKTKTFIKYQMWIKKPTNKNQKPSALVVVDCLLGALTLCWSWAATWRLRLKQARNFLNIA